MGVLLVVDAGGSDIGAGIAMRSGSGGSAKNPERVVGAVLVGEDVDVKLRLTLLPRTQRKR